MVARANSEQGSNQPLIGLAVAGVLLHGFSNYQVIWAEGDPESGRRHLGRAWSPGSCWCSC